MIKLLLLSLSLAILPSTANVIGIDFGGDNIKVGMISPGKFDIGTAHPSPHFLFTFMLLQ
jgi:molecular chaperone DnaK (HSP70)